MHELDELRQIAHLIRQPPLEALATTARRRRRRVAVSAAAIGAAFALLVAGGAFLTGYDDQTAPQPAGDPTPGRMTPNEIVTGPNSTLVTAATSLDDPDVRISVWEATCPGCDQAGGKGSTKLALALTTDGFATTTYAASPALNSPRPRFVGVVGPRIESPAEGLFLLVDTNRPGEWLVGTDGAVRRVERTSTPLEPTDRRLWFRCHPAETPSAWKESELAFVDAAHLYPWCALNPESATAYEWPARWSGSLALPSSAEEPWGVDTLWQPTFAWWEVDGQRQRQFLADSPEDARGPVWNSPTGGPLFFTKIGLEPTLDLLVPRGPELRVVTRTAPDVRHQAGSPFSSEQVSLVTGTPEGALLAVRTYRQPAIWRAESLADADLELVHESKTGDPDTDQTAPVHEPIIVGDRIHIMTPKGVLVSDDDGRTWTQITRWR